MGDLTTTSAQEQEETPLAYRAVRGGLWVAASSYWTIGFGFVANIVLTRMLSPEAFGAFALAMFFVQLYRIQPWLGLSKAYAQYKGPLGQALGTYFVLESVAACGSVLIALLAQVLLPHLGYTETIARISLVLLFAALMESFVSVGNTLLDKELRFKQSSWVNGIAFPLSYLPAFWLAHHQAGFWSLIAQNATYNLLTMIGVWAVVYRQLPDTRKSRWQFDMSLARQFLKFGLTLGIANFVSMLITRVDSFLIGTFSGETELGFYNRAYRMAEWPALLFYNLMNRAAFFTYARLQDDKPRLRKTVTMITWLIANIALPVVLMLFITAPDLVAVLYGEQWMRSVPFLRVLLVAAIIRPLWSSASTFFTAVGRPALTVKYSVLQLVLLALLGGTLTWRLGAMGTCIAISITLIVNVILAYRVIISETQASLLNIFISKLCISFLIAGGYILLNRYTGLTNLSLQFRLIIKGMYVLISFFAFIFILQPRDTLMRARYVYELASKR